MSAVAAEQIALIDLDKLEVHPSNPRKDVGDITELAASIKSAGLIEPIVAVKHNGTFQVVAGSRRLAAARKAKLQSLPVRVMDLDEAQAMAAALIENLQRKDLEPLEQAEAFRGWLTLTGKTQKELGETVGLAPSTIANALRLLDAPQPVRQALREQRITAAHARVALELKDPSLATKLPLAAGVRVDDLKVKVDQLNRESALSGTTAVAAAKAYLEKAKAAHPKATITWSPRKSFNYAQRVVDLVAALGKPPAAIAGPVQIGGGLRFTSGGDYAPTEKMHAKVCSCVTYELTASQDYSHGDALVLGLERVCSDPKAYKAARPKKAKSRVTGLPLKSSKPARPKAPSAAQVKAQQERERKAIDGEVKRLLDPGRARIAKFAPLFKKLATTGIPAEIARAIIAGEILVGAGDDGVAAAAWERVRTLPAKKLSQIAGAITARVIEDNAGYSIIEWTSTMLATFGVKVAAKKQARR